MITIGGYTPGPRAWEIKEAVKRLKESQVRVGKYYYAVMHPMMVDHLKSWNNLIKMSGKTGRMKGVKIVWKRYDNKRKKN